MNIIILASSRAALPCMHMLHSENLLAAVCCPGRNDYELQDISGWAGQHGVRLITLSESGLEGDLCQLIVELGAAVVVACTFPYKIPKSLLTLPKHGFLNIHFSRLPAYRGPSPVFWQIRNGEKLSGVSIHRMDKDFDTGTVLRMLEVPVFPGETTGLCTARLSYLVPGMLKKLLGEDLQPEVLSNMAADSYYSRPRIADMCIDWASQTASEIECLVNACNHNGNGALTSYRSQPLQVIEVSPVDGAGGEGVAGGTIVHADGTGLFIQCTDRRLLRLNILKMNEGIVSGFRLAAMGIQAGERLEMPVQASYNLKH